MTLQGAPCAARLALELALPRRLAHALRGEACGEFSARRDTGLALAVERFGEGRAKPLFDHAEHLDVLHEGRAADGQAIAPLDQLGGLGPRTVDLDAAIAHGVRGEAARAEEARVPQPAVDTLGVVRCAHEERVATLPGRGAARYTARLAALRAPRRTDRNTNMGSERQFIPLDIAILTVSDTRDEATDTSGRLLMERVLAAGHRVRERTLCRDDIYAIRAIVSRWIADEAVAAVLTTGGTGVTGRDGTPEAVQPLLDKTLDGFGEMFRVLSFDDIGTSTMQSRAIAGVANGTYLFCLPGSSGACALAWDRLVSAQLDYRTRPCNLVELMPRLREH